MRISPAQEDARFPKGLRNDRIARNRTGKSSADTHVADSAPSYYRFDFPLRLDVLSA
jgi:hypothetical protein